MQVDDPAESAGYVLWKLTHAMQQRMSSALGELRLNLPQLGTLVHIARGDSISTADLARTVLMTPQNMSLTVRKLEADGLIERRPHETHGRIFRLTLTRSGERALQRAIRVAADVEDEMLHGISRLERAKLTAHLQKALDNLGPTGGRR